MRWGGVGRCEDGASNGISYRHIHNFPDTADLPDWCEVVYDDGFVDTVPVRPGKAVRL